MPRLPEHEARKNRQEVWDYIRENKVFRLHDITNATLIHNDTVATYIYSLCNGSYVERLDNKGTTKRGRKAGFVNKQAYKEQTYKLIKDIGFTAPKIKRDGSLCMVGRGREQMWQTMKIIKEFSVPDLAIASSTEETDISVESCREYVCYLAKAKYLAQTHKGNKPRYRFVPAMSTGPQPPVLQSKRSAVYDPNIEKIMWRKEEAAEVAHE